MQKRPLFCHPDTPCSFVESFDASAILMPDGRLQLRYRLTGDISKIKLPALAAREHQDGLWQHTCFEAFLKAGDRQDYREFNFSPSGAWAAYAFASYREGGRRNLEPALDISCAIQPNAFQLDVTLPASTPPAGQPLQTALTAVIEAQNGDLTYWSLHHPSGKPDFHHPDNFVHLISTEPSP